MNYRKEAREVTQEMYGGYCNMCRELNIEIVPYYKFSEDYSIYEDVRNIFQAYKRNKRNKNNNKNMENLITLDELKEILFKVKSINGYQTDDIIEAVEKYMNSKPSIYIKPEIVNIDEECMMDMYAKKGTKVALRHKEGKIKGGRDYDQEQALEFLTLDGVYTVESTDVGDWSSTVELQEFPGKHFNTVMFKDVK